MTTNRLAKLKARRMDPLVKVAGMNEVYERISEDEDVKYAVGAMQPIDPEYTRNTFEEGDRVKSQLEKGLNQPFTSAEFEYQGSVTNDTHIKSHSDIDLLTLHAGFYTIQPPGRPTVVYQGDVIADLRGLRASAAQTLRSAFPKVTMDDSPGKSISLQGGSLRRKIDVVISNWWDTAEYQASPLPHHRGVQIFDSKANVRIENRPFLHNARIDEKDRVHQGNVRKVARLLKSLKYEADTKVEISSYDVVSIAYNMPEPLMRPGKGSELLLVENTKWYLQYLLDNEPYRVSIRVPNDMRPVFCNDGASLEGLKQLHTEVRDLVNDINKGLSRSFRKLAEARVEY